jgi:molybdopterin-guanine dinucleotide biosynthesis protein A
VQDDPALPAGPLNGVLAGLDWAHKLGLDFLATAPCDAPLLPEDLFAHLRDAIADASAAYVATSDGDHPLCALWRVDLAPSLRAALTRGVHPPVWRFLEENGAHAVRFADAARFANANTPETLAALERAS